MARHPQRVLMEGIAEQHIVGMASGLALEGFVPYVHTIGTFLTRRALEQVIVDAALHSFPVRLVASGGGMVYAPLGPTHQAIDDFALMRAIPGMAVIAPIDPSEMRSAILELASWEGPAYVRVGKGGEPIVTDSSLVLGDIRILRSGTEGVVFTTGSVGHEVLQAVDEVARSGISLTVAHVPTIAPMDEEACIGLLEKFPTALVVEEHLPEGGLWTSLVEVAARNDVYCHLHQASLPRSYASNYGSQYDHWDACGLSSRRLAQHFDKIWRAANNG
jgi:transketolase